MSGAIYITRSRPENLDLLARCMDVAAWGFLNGRLVSDHPRAKARPEEDGPAEWGPFEETILGILVDGSVEGSPASSLPHPFDSAFRSFHLVLVMHLDRTRILMLPTTARHAAAEMSFQMREDRMDLPAEGTVHDLSDFASRMASICRSAVPSTSPEAASAEEELLRRARIFATLGQVATGRPLSLGLISGDEGEDDIVIADGPDGQVHFSPALCHATAAGHPVVRTVGADHDATILMYRNHDAIAWDGVVKGHVSRPPGASVEDYDPDPMEILRLKAEWSAFEPHVFDPQDGNTDEHEERDR